MIQYQAIKSINTQRYKEALLKKTELSLKEKDVLKKKLELNQNVSVHHCL